MGLCQLQAQEGSFVTPCIPCASVDYRGRVFFAKLLQKGANNADIFSRWLARPLCSSLGFSSRLPDFCWLWHSQSRPLSSSLHCRLPSLRLPSPTEPLWVPWPTAPLASLGPVFPPSLPVSLEISSSGICLVSHQNRQRNRLPGIPPT